jgi:hypothetical protein
VKRRIAAMSEIVMSLASTETSRRQELRNVLGKEVRADIGERLVPLIWEYVKLRILYQLVIAVSDIDGCLAIVGAPKE